MQSKMFRLFNRFLFIGLTLWFAGDRTSAAAEKEPPSARPAKSESWCVIYLGGQRIGYHQSVEETLVQDGTAIVKTSIVSSMTFKRFGQSTVIRTLQTSEETVDGHLRRLRYEVENPPASPKITT